MNKKSIKLVCSVMILTLFVSLMTIPVLAKEDTSKDIKLVLNGTELVFDVPPQMINNRTMVPMRVIFEALGADVYWDVFSEWIYGGGSVKMITAVKNENKIIMSIDEPNILKFIGYVGDAPADFFDQEAEVIELDVSPQLIDGRTLVPVRAISEAFGIEVDWNHEAKTVILSCDEKFIENKNIDKDFHDSLIDYLNESITDGQTTEITEITVSTADELVAALGSNRKILLQPGTYNLSSIKQNNTADSQAYWNEVFDGNELCINGVENLTIQGIGKTPSKIIVEPRYADVMRFINSEGIVISNIEAGHTPDGYCTGGVFSFENCSDIKMDATNMYGCGTEGLNLKNVTNMTVTNSSIYECTYYIMVVFDSQNISFDNCEFRDNEMFDLVNIHYTSNLSINNCEFNNNFAITFGDDESCAMFSVSSSENIRVTNTTFNDNTAFTFSNSDRVVFENNVFKNNQFTNFSYPQ